MGAPKPRPLINITRHDEDTVVIRLNPGLNISLLAAHTYNYPSGGTFHLYPTEAAQVATRLAKHFGIDWQVKYTDSDGEDKWRPMLERIQFIYDTATSRLAIAEVVDISDDGPWSARSKTRITTDKRETITQTQPPTTREDTSMGSIEQIITDIIDLRLAGHKPALDEDAIRNLVAEGIKGVKPPRIEIVTNGEHKVLDKHTHPMFGKVLSALSVARQSTKWPFLVGPAGTGKTTMGEHLAEALDIPFLAFPANPTAMLHDILGFVSPTSGEYVGTPYVELMRNGGVLLFDETDKWHPGLFSGLNMLLAQGIVVLPDGTRFPIHKDCYFIGGANTWGTGPDSQYVGSNQLDAASLNRFVRIPVDYDTDYEESRAAAVLGARNGALWCAAVKQMRTNRDTHRIDTIISTRDVIACPTLVATGNITPEQAVDWTIVANLKADHKARLIEGVDLSCLSVKK